MKGIVSWGLMASEKSGACIVVFGATKKQVIEKFDSEYYRSGFIIRVWKEEFFENDEWTDISQSDFIKKSHR